jgi:hypothetical protein
VYKRQDNLFSASKKFIISNYEIRKLMVKCKILFGFSLNKGSLLVDH